MLMNGQAKHAYDEGIVAIAGSAVGLTAAGRISVAGIALDSQLLIQLAGVGYIISPIFHLPPWLSEWRPNRWRSVAIQSFGGIGDRRLSNLCWHYRIATLLIDYDVCFN